MKKKKDDIISQKKLSTLLHGITNIDFYCLKCLYSFRTENKLNSHEKVCKNVWGIAMPSEKNNISEFNELWSQVNTIHYWCSYWIFN